MRRDNVPMRSLLSMPFLVYLSIIVLFRGCECEGLAAMEFFIWQN